MIKKQSLKNLYNTKSPTKNSIILTQQLKLGRKSKKGFQKMIRKIRKKG
jgi:hypothetical protein